MEEDQTSIGNFQGEFDTWRPGQTQLALQAQPAQQTQQAQQAQQTPERDKIAIKSVRATHSLWDRQQREWMGVLAQSDGNPNTKGCKFEEDLRIATKQCNTLDEDLMTVERKFIANKPLTDEDLATAGSAATKLVDMVKDGNKKCAAIKAWIKVGI